MHDTNNVDTMSTPNNIQPTLCSGSSIILQDMHVDTVTTDIHIDTDIYANSVNSIISTLNPLATSWTPNTVVMSELYHFPEDPWSSVEDTPDDWFAASLIIQGLILLA